MFGDILTRDFLLEEYKNKRKTKAGIAKELGTTVQTVHKYCVLHEIESNEHCEYVSDNLKDKEYGDLIVLERAENDRHGKTRWFCQCSCGATKVINAASLIRKLSKSCGKAIHHKDYKGYRDISYAWWRRLRDNAASRGYEFSITIEFVWELFEQQARKCALTGLPIDFCCDSNKPYSQSASVDRVDSGLGYTPDNVQIVHKMVNLMKSFLSMSEFVHLCNLVATIHPISKEDLDTVYLRVVLQKDKT